MEHYLIFLAVACATVATPGPGVLLTITNTLRYGFWGAIPGIVGLAIGVLCVAVISATSLAVIVVTSALAFSALKFCGAVYLIYLGIKLWRSSNKFQLDNADVKSENVKVRFMEGVLTSLLNPKAIFFFMSLFPQFIDPRTSYLTQFLVLAITFSLIIIVVHCFYSVFAARAKNKLSSSSGSKWIGRVGGSVYLLFGIGLASTRHSV